MATDVRLFKGGTPDISFMNCEGHPVTSRPPFGNINEVGTPPFDAHYDGAYNLGDFCAGFPFQPKIMQYQHDNITSAIPRGTETLAVDDFLQMIVVPCNHYVESLRFDVGQPDANLAGATVQLTAQSVVWDPTANNNTGAYIWTEIPYVTDAATAQGKDDPIDVSMPMSVTIWLGKVTAGYIEYLYAEPIFTETGTGPSLVRTRHQEGGIILGVKILSLPTEPGVTFQGALNDWYLTCRMRCFESPGFL